MRWWFNGVIAVETKLDRDIIRAEGLGIVMAIDIGGAEIFIGRKR